VANQRDEMDPKGGIFNGIRIEDTGNRI